MCSNNLFANYTAKTCGRVAGVAGISAVSQVMKSNFLNFYVNFTEV